MSQRAHERSRRFEETSEAFAIEMERLSPEQWSALSPEAGQTVAALVRHVAWAYEFEVAAFKAIAVGNPPPAFTQDALDEINVDRGAAHANCDQTETIALLRRNAAAAAAIVRDLTDEQLARTGDFIDPDDPGSVDLWIEYVLIAHPGMHLPAIRTAVASVSAFG